MAAASPVSSSQILRPVKSQAHSEASHETRHGAINSFKNQASAYHGLRALNQVDMLHARTMPQTNLSRSRSSTVQVTRSPVIVCGNGMNIVFVAAEAAPWSKTGGLGDVLGGLPPALAGRGNRVMSVSPRYDQYKDAWDTGVVVEIKVGKELYNVRYFHSYKDGVDRVFVDHPMFLERVWGTTGPKLYGPKPGEDYPDNDKRFSILNQAAIEATRVLNLKSSPNHSGPYGEDVVFVCNDWHTALLPVYLKNAYKSHGSYRNAKSVLCIHNISYQGRFPFEEFETLGLPDGAQSSLEFVERYNGGIEKINWMKGGIMEADRVMTVSPYYAEELVSSPFKGMELENVLRKTGVTGILNGVDVLEWNPAADKYIPFKYDLSTVSQAKPRDKEALQAELGLPVNRNIPMIGFIARLEEQKGSDIFAASVPEFIGENVQVVALGTGKPKFEEQLKQLEKKYPNKVRGLVKYSPDLVHKIIAGSDFMLITSRFEPGGLIQLQSMRYGTVPIVSSTGGLVNSVMEGYTGFHMGAFDVDGTKVNPRDVTAVTSTVKRALGVYGTPTFERMISNCMSQDFSWTESAEKWEKVLMGVAAGAVPREEELAPRARSVAVAL